LAEDFEAAPILMREDCRQQSRPKKAKVVAEIIPKFSNS